MLYVMLLLHFNIFVSEVIHVAAEQNVMCDILSRVSSFEEAKLKSPLFDNIHLLEIDGDSLIKIINPHVIQDDPVGFISMWNKLSVILKTI